MKEYHEHLQTILEQGTWKDPARVGMPRSLSLFGHQNRYDLQKGFPIVTTKKVNFSNIVVELLWFLKGDTNIKYLVDNGCNIWNEDAYNYYKKIGRKYNVPESEDLSFEEFIQAVKDGDRISLFDDYKSFGDCGKQYGWLWRKWSIFQEVPDIQFDEPGNKYETTRIEEDSLDQIKNLIKGLKENPEGRRHIITAWNPATLDDMALNACHAFVQFNCRKIPNQERQILGGKPTGEYNLDNVLNVPKYYLDCQLYQRSADMFLGVPYNISSYALLTHIIAKICNMEVGHFIHTFGDSHIYENHMDQVKELLSRDPEKYKLPILKIKDEFLDDLKDSLEHKENFGDFIQSIQPEDFTLENYESYPPIKAPLSTGLK